MATTVVFVEHTGGAARRGSLEALGAAHSIGAECVAVLVGPGADEVAGPLGAHGATRAVILTDAREGFSSDLSAKGIAAVVRDERAGAFLAAASSTGKDLGPRVAAELDCVHFADCTELTADGGALTLRRPWLAGKCIATLRSAAEVLCATTRLNAFPVVETDGAAEVTTRALEGEARVRVTAIAPKPVGKLDVNEAAVVVSGGRGLRESANFSLVEDLAAAFGGAAVGASRAVVDAGWRPHAEQVGQTGKTVSPQLYIAVGISGAIQHLAGMRTSGTIVAINKDPDAPIFKVADYGIVGDAFEVVPVLTEEIKKIKARG